MLSLKHFEAWYVEAKILDVYAKRLCFISIFKLTPSSGSAGDASPLR